LRIAPFVFRTDYSNLRQAELALLFSETNGSGPVWQALTPVVGTFDFCGHTAGALAAKITLDVSPALAYKGRARNRKGPKP
jgi:hypothetical protein